MSKKLFTTVFGLLFFLNFSFAQNWQWGKRGGSSDTYGSGADETVKDMATDPHGNVYVLSQVLKTGLNVDGHGITGWGSQDIMISSFKCDGTYRWSKIIGTSSDDDPVALRTDSVDGVYVTGSIAPTTATHLDADTTWSGTYQRIFLAKYDTAGNYKWLRTPEPDSITVWGLIAHFSFPSDMDVDKSGNVYLLSFLAPGAYAGGGFVVTTDGYYILKYDKTGNFMGGTPLQISYTGTPWLLNLKRDVQNNRYYITGTNNSPSGAITFGGNPILSSIFIGCFSNSGVFQWQKQNTHDTGNPTSRADIDAQNNLYIASIVTTIDTFNGFDIPPGAGPVVFKMDSNGNNLWSQYGIINAATFCHAVVVNGSEVDISGYYPGKLKWPGYSDSLNIAPGPGGYRIFITRFDMATGAVIGLDSIGSDPTIYNEATSITADKSGNFYVGGDFGYRLFFPGLSLPGDTLNYIGGHSDFFMAKYGYANCSCTAPVASFTHTGTSTLSFTYTGSGGYDSLRWSFGDGGTATAANPMHTYTSVGTYTVCVTVYTSCGSNNSCQTISISTTGISAVPGAFGNVAIYPNPVTDQVFAAHCGAGTIIRLLNPMGQQVYSGIITEDKQAISTHNLLPGSYIIQLIDKNGNTMSRTLIKE